MSCRENEAGDHEGETGRGERPDRRVVPVESARLDHLDLDRRRGRGRMTLVYVPCCRSKLGRPRGPRADGREREGQRGVSG